MSVKYAQLVKHIELLRESKYNQAANMHPDSPTWLRTDARKAFELYNGLLKDIALLEEYGTAPRVPDPHLGPEPF